MTDYSCQVKPPSCARLLHARHAATVLSLTFAIFLGNSYERHPFNSADLHCKITAASGLQPVLVQLLSYRTMVERPGMRAMTWWNERGTDAQVQHGNASRWKQQTGRGGERKEETESAGRRGKGACCFKWQSIRSLREAPWGGRLRPGAKRVGGAVQGTRDRGCWGHMC